MYLKVKKPHLKINSIMDKKLGYLIIKGFCVICLISIILACVLDCSKFGVYIAYGSVVADAIWVYISVLFYFKKQRQKTEEKFIRERLKKNFLTFVKKNGKNKTK